MPNRRFDAHPEVQARLQATKADPGAFAKAIDALPPSVMNELKKNRFTSVAVPAIPDGYLPPPRVQEREDDHA